MAKNEDRLSTSKDRIGFALNKDAQQLLRALKGKLGVSQAGVVELAIHEKAAREGIELEQNSNGTTT